MGKRKWECGEQERGRGRQGEREIDEKARWTGREIIRIREGGSVWQISRERVQVGSGRGGREVERGREKGEERGEG